MPWECAIEACGHRTETADELLVHQVTAHDRVRCAVCGASIPDGYFGIRHVFDEHTRAQYVRTYAADPHEVAQREEIVESVEAAADVEAVLADLRERVDPTG